MQHPILYIKRNLLLYGVISLLIGAGFVLLISLITSYNIAYIIIDSLSFVFVFSIIGIWVWYVIRHNATNTMSKNNRWVWIQLVSALLIIFVCLSISALLRKLLCFIFGVVEPSIPFEFFIRFVVALIFYAIIAMFYYLVYFLRDIQEKELHEEQLQSLLKEIELKHLISQINPHFLFNSLNSIHSLILSDADKATEMLVKLSEYFRYSLKNGKKQFQKLEEELNNCKRYLNIEKIRFENRLESIFDVEEECFDYKIPSMILQPLYENVIKHAVHEAESIIKVHTKINTDDDFMRICISNNIEKGTVSAKGEGIGLQNIMQRLNRIYGNKQDFIIKKTEDNFKVVILIPKTKNND